MCLGLLVLTVLAVVAPSVLACQTPVFRYALEKWPGDYYPLMIYNDAPLNSDDQAIADWLEEVQETEGAQVSVYVLDISKPAATQPATTQPTTQPAQSRTGAPSSRSSRFAFQSAAFSRSTTARASKLASKSAPRASASRAVCGNGVNSAPRQTSRSRAKCLMSGGTTITWCGAEGCVQV